MLTVNPEYSLKEENLKILGPVKYYTYNENRINFNESRKKQVESNYLDNTIMSISMYGMNLEAGKMKYIILWKRKSESGKSEIQKGV